MMFHNINKYIYSKVCLTTSAIWNWGRKDYYMINDMPSDHREQERQNSVWKILGEIGSSTDVPFITQITRTAAESDSYR